MRLTLAIDALSPHPSGIGRYCRELLQGLRRRRDVERLRYFRDQTWPRHPERYCDEAWIGRQKAWKIRPFLRPAVHRFMARDALFHTPNYFLPDFAERGIATIHDLSVLRFPETHPPERLALFERHFHDTVNRAEHLITDSRTVADELVRDLGVPAAKVSSVPLGVSAAYRPDAHLASPDCLARFGMRANGYILVVGTLEPRKRIDRALTAFRCLPEAMQRAFPLVIAGGEGWRNEALVEQVRREEERGLVRHIAYVPEHELPALYAGAALFIFPSLYEGFGLPLVEAMASGTPVVTANISCMPEVTQGAAMLADPEDVDGFAEALHRGLEDEIWRSTAVEQGLAVASGYSWDRCVEGTVEIYRSLWAA